MHYSEWAEERKESSRRASRTWAANNQEKLKEDWANQYENQTPEYKLLKPARDRARKGGYECTITEIDIHITKSCPICNTTMRRSSQRGGDRYSPTIDKVKPELGYTPSNVAVICKLCNSQKGNASAKEHRRIADFIDKF